MTLSLTCSIFLAPISACSYILLAVFFPVKCKLCYLQGSFQKILNCFKKECYFKLHECRKFVIYLVHKCSTQTYTWHLICNPWEIVDWVSQLFRDTFYKKNEVRILKITNIAENKLRELLMEKAASSIIKNLPNGFIINCFIIEI